MDGRGAELAPYVVEAYLGRTSRGDVALLRERVRLAAEAVSLGGLRVRLVRSLYVPVDETCLYLFEAQSAAAVAAAGARADVVFDRIAEAVA